MHDSVDFSPPFLKNNMKYNYIGLACTFHDPAIAVVNSSGQLVFAEAAERHFQTKRAFNCPPDTYVYINKIIESYCEPDASIVVARSWSPQFQKYLRPTNFIDVCRNAYYKLRWPNTSSPSFEPITHFILKSMANSVSNASEGVRYYLKKTKQASIEVLGFNHHLTHAATACYTSKFDEAVCAIIDGFGEWTSTGFYHYRNGKLIPLGAARGSNSLGLFYGAICGTCGFDSEKGEEWKVMGLAGYGKRNDEVYQALSHLIRVDGLGLVGLRDLLNYPFWELAKRADRADIAHTGQLVFEEKMREILQNLYTLGLSKNLVLGGGCALNSSYNGRVLENIPFDELHVASAPGDDGNAIGAALLACEKKSPGKITIGSQQSAYLGSRMSETSMANLIRFSSPEKLSHHPGTIHQVAARLLAEGRIIGWSRGRAEFGPRALGNRSILADPRSPDVKERINSVVKFREEFRPFAPSILHEHGPEYFENYQESRYMERTLRFRQDVISKVPGVVHVDQTGRLQTVRREWNEDFYLLIAEFYRLSGVPLVLNTSFNVMGKPIIHTVEDAIAVFHTSGLDDLFLEDYHIRK